MMENTHTIPQDPELITGLNPIALKQEALSYIQRFAPETWTDHNLHDPGITILEVLCYVITDLSYRLSFPVKDLLQPKNESEVIHHFWTASDILHSSPVTFNDYRRLIIDLEGVQNAWLMCRADDHNTSSANDERPNLPGRVWDILVQPEYSLHEDEQMELARTIQRLMSRNRTIGDDIQHIHFLPVKYVDIDMHLELKRNCDIEETIAQIFADLHDEISPVIPVKNLQELKKNGERYDSIFEGPKLENGLIDHDVIEAGEQTNQLFTSDLVARVFTNSSVEAVAHLDVELEGSTSSGWVTTTDDNTSLLLRIDAYTDGEDDSVTIDPLDNIKVTIDGQNITLGVSGKARIHRRIKELLDAESEVHTDVPDDYLDGRYRMLNRYRSLQKEFPQVYKLGGSGFADNESDSVKTQIRQLQGFLLLFDQVLANQFELLENIRHLLSLPERGLYDDIEHTFCKMFSSESIHENEVGRFWDAVNALPKTYLSQPVNDIHQMPELLGEFNQIYHSDEFDELGEEKFSLLQLDRMVRLYKHLLARFHEPVNDPSLLKLSGVIRNYTDRLKDHYKAPAVEDDELFVKKLVMLKQINDMATLLNNYPRMSTNRCGAYDYLGSQVINSASTSDLSTRIAALLGIPQFKYGAISNKNQEAFHLIESTLLRHQVKDDSDIAVTNGQCLDQLYLVIPEWPTRFANAEFRKILEQTISAETPLHLKPLIVYLDREMMGVFDRVYNAWKNAMTQLPCDTNAVGSVYNSWFSLENNVADKLEASMETSLKLISRLSKIIHVFFHVFSEKALDELVTALADNESDTLPDTKEEKISFVQSKGNKSIIYSLYKMLVDENVDLNDLPCSDKLCAIQEKLDEIIKPYAIGDPDTLINKTFRVGYQSIDYLKPVHPMKDTAIYPDDETAKIKSTFTIAISNPKQIGGL